MTLQKSSFTRRRRFLSSLGAKITMILMAVSAASALVGVLVSLVFDRVASDMGRLTQDMLPQLEVSADLTVAAGLTRDSMTDILLAKNSAELADARAQAEEATKHLNTGIESLPETLRPDFDAAADNAAQSLADLLAARGTVFENTSQIEAQITALQDHSGTLQTHLFEAAEAASLELTVGGENTITSIENTLTKLVDGQFNALRVLLEGQADINLLAGMSVGLGLVREVPMKRGMKKIASAAKRRLAAFLGNLDALELVAKDKETIQNAVKVFNSILTAKRSEQKTLRGEVLKAREASAAALTEAIKNRVQELTAAAEKSSASNREAVQSLLDNEVSMLNQLLEVNTLINTLQMAALQVVSADNSRQVQDAAVPLQNAAMALKGFSGLKGGILADDIEKIVARADTSTGLAAARIAAIAAQGETVVASQAAAKAVADIAQQAGTLSGQSQEAIAGMAVAVSAEVLDAEQKMYALFAVAAAVLLFSIFLTRILVTRPLAKISSATESLANGDRSPISGFERSSDEIRRIAKALSVFRDGLVEKDGIVEATEAERQERLASQAAAVAAIGRGLESLSQGDLTVRINESMSEGYVKLRDDFNATLETLNSTVVDVVGAADSISNGAIEISQASDDLSQRTESQAATLEQTAAALEELTESVKSAADGARSVETIVNEARDEAEVSGQVVESAVTAMTEIEQSAKQISQIIGVIDDIAFQTNLLALNAGVEAARAGEAGRGFAVVASEVRALAQRSSDAASEIKTLIGDSSRQVDQGVDLVGKAGTALHSIVTRVGTISQLVSEIASGAGEQSTGLGEINVGIAQLDQVTQQNAAMVEESTAAARSLASEADELSRLVARFKMNAISVTAAASASAAVPSMPAQRQGAHKVAQAAPTMRGNLALAVDQDDWSEF